MDLACSPGFDPDELASFATPNATVFEVEISPDFIASITQRNADDGCVEVIKNGITKPLDFSIVHCVLCRSVNLLSATQEEVLDPAKAKEFTLNREYRLDCWRWYSFSRV